MYKLWISSTKILVVLQHPVILDENIIKGTCMEFTTYYVVFTTLHIPICSIADELYNVEVVLGRLLGLF